MKKKLLTIFLVSTSLLAACNTNAQNQGETEIIETAAGESFEITRMSGGDLEAIQQDNDEKEKYLVIDVRDSEQYEEGHLKHAINIPLDNFENELDVIDGYQDEPVVVYCNTDNSSSEAAQILADNGFNNVTIADGVKEYEEYEMYTFETVLPTEFMEGAADASAVFIDSRDEADWEESRINDALLGDGENPEAVVAELPEDKSTPIYSYCYSGNRSTSVADAAARAGYTNVYNAFDGTKEFDGYPLQ